MTRRDLIAVAAVAPWLPASAAAAAEPLDWLLGAWHGTGTFFGRPSKATLDATLALSGRFLELNWTASNGAMHYAGRGLYRHAGADMPGHWYDSTGAVRPLTATLSATALRSAWTGQENGASLYRREGEALIVEDRVASAQGDRLFAAHQLIRER